MPKKQFEGVVVSDKMDKTVVVKVERIKIHPKFKKQYKTHKKYKAHDEHNQCKVGDVVLIEETRPLSKEKRWRVIKIIRKSVELENEKEGIKEEIEKGEIKTNEETTSPNQDLQSE